VKTPSEILAERLGVLGFRPARVAAHRNRTVLLSFTNAGGLRIHEGFAMAPDRVLQAIARFLNPRVPRAERAAARRIFLSFPVASESDAVPRGPRPERPRPGDATLLTRLTALHAELNDRHFSGALGAIPIHLSGRMRTRLGELALDRRSGRPLRITIGRRHLRRDGWDEAAETLLHEMVHQWQAETGQPVDHGAGFRRKAREVGIVPRAVRPLNVTCEPGQVA
jgi:hypothetical protein